MRALGYSGPNMRPMTRKDTIAAFRVGKIGIAAVASKAIRELGLSRAPRWPKRLHSLDYYGSSVS